MGGRGPVPPPPPRFTPSIHGLRKYPSAFGIDHPVSTKPRSRIYTPDGAGFEQALLHSIGKAWVVEDLTRRHHQVSFYFQPIRSTVSFGIDRLGCYIGLREDRFGRRVRGTVAGPIRIS